VHPPQLVLELRVRLLDGTRLGPDRSRDPVEGPELVDDAAFDARDGVGLELEPRDGSNFSIASMSPKIP
jgi:hypothetical protein